MTTLGYLVIAVGILVALYGEVRFLVVAYNRNLWWFFGCLFLPFVGWIFLLLNLKATIRPFAVSTLGLIAVGLGAWMAGIIFPL
jgi:hypothetical protein